MRLRARAEALCFKGNRVLCAFAPEGYVVFPGGGIDVDESAREAARREAAEESDRRVSDLHVAHPPTVQLWPPGYANGTWSKDYQGGLTYWMTGSASEDPIHVNPKERHKDFMPGFAWRPIDEVLLRLKRELDGDWAEDSKVRVQILEAHLQIDRKIKVAAAIPLCVRYGVPELKGCMS
jgi:8-oxo-dGTP pyrophosphatase MutT (NUDIX family)